MLDVTHTKDTINIDALIITPHSLLCLKNLYFDQDLKMDISMKYVGRHQQKSYPRNSPQEQYVHENLTFVGQYINDISVWTKAWKTQKSCNEEERHVATQAP